jgi:hypothetical protein
MNSEIHFSIKRSLTTEAKVALVFGITSVILSLLGSLALYINIDIQPGAIKGPHPWIANIGQYFRIGGFYGCLASVLVSFIAIFTGFFNKPRMLNVASGCLGLIIAYIAGIIFLETISRSRHAAGEFNSIRSLGYTLKKYTEEHNGRNPQAIKWCDELIAFDANSSNEMRKGRVKNDEGLSDFALNANLSEQKLAEVSKNAVLLFGTKLAKNPVGGVELINAEDHPLKGCFVLFGDMHVEFVRAEDFNNLRWKP